MQNKQRRKLLKGVAGVSVASIGAMAVSACSSSASVESAASSNKPLALKGNINHSVSRWTYRHLSIEELCQTVKSLGFSAIDLVGPKDWPVLKKHGIDSSMCNGAELNLKDGFIHPEHHDALVERYLTHIDLVAEAGYKNLICFSGNARGMDRETGLKNAVAGLERILPHAEKKGVVICMELFNSKVNHPDYMADNTTWSIELCKRLNSNNFSLLYDIYHMQISEGDIIRTIQNNHQYFGHYHTAGVPGRHEIGSNQELNYTAIANAIKETGFTGYLAQEFLPTPSTNEGKFNSLKEAIEICDV